ncbi:MAG: hypothetical protein WCK02_10170 [Bacteroidota bacterium]
MKKIGAIFLVLGSVFLTLFFSCKKESLQDFGYQAAKDDAVSESIFADAFKQVDNAIRDTNVFYGLSNGCPTITQDTATFPKVITIDYGAGCADSLTGIVRSGKIIISLSKPWLEVGAVAVCSFENYIVDSYTISYFVKQTITFKGRANNLLNFAVEVSDGEITSSEGVFYCYSSRIFELYLGESTAWPKMNDDVWRITGTAKGYDINGKEYFDEIIYPLISQVGCHWIKKGTIEIKPEKGEIISLDFGSGTCDDSASATYNGNTYGFVIK